MFLAGVVLIIIYFLQWNFNSVKYVRKHRGVFEESFSLCPGGMLLDGIIYNLRIGGGSLKGLPQSLNQ